MRIRNDLPEAETLAMDQSAALLGIHEFSLLSRTQAGEITAARVRSGEIAVPISELERLLHRPINVADVANRETPLLPDRRLGIEKRWSGLKRLDGGMANYTVPGYFARFTESEIQGYRAAFSAIAPEFESLMELKKQLDTPSVVVPSSVKEITAEGNRWQMRSTLLNLGQSDILLCQGEDGFAVVERFREGSPYAKAKGNAEILLDGNDAGELTEAFRENANHTLEFMASNQVATAQKVIWEQFPDHRPARLVAAISERCRLAVTNEETIAEAPKISQSHSRGMSI